MISIKHSIQLIGLSFFVVFQKLKKFLIVGVSGVLTLSFLLYILFCVWRFRCIPGYEWNFSITLYESLLGFSALIGAVTVIIGGVKWLVNKLNPNTTTIKSFLPYIKIGGDIQTCHQIKSQQEFSQILRESPLETLQMSRIIYLIRFNSVINNENKIIYKSTCKPRYNLKWIIDVEKVYTNDKFSQRIERAKSYLLKTDQYEEYIVRNNTDDITHELECAFVLDPILFLSFYKNISICVKVENTDKSKTSWHTSSLNIDEQILKRIQQEIPKFNTHEERNNWLREWRENFRKNNEDELDLKYK